MRKPTYCAITTYLMCPMGATACLCCSKDSMPERCKELNDSAPKWEKSSCIQCANMDDQWHCAIQGHKVGIFDYACKDFVERIRGDVNNR